MSKRMHSEIGITGPQRLALRVVGLFPGTSAGDLAAILHIHPSTATGVLQRLTAQGLLVRRTDAEDRRRVTLHLTARGRRVNSVKRRTVEWSIGVALNDSSARDRGTAKRVLTQLAAVLNGDKPAPSIGQASRRRKRPRPSSDATSSSA